MFKNATIYTINPGFATTHGDICRQLGANEFAETGSTQQKSVGWVPPREKNGAFVESVGGQWIAKLVIETRAVPASALNKAVDKAAAFVEDQTGRKPGRKKRLEIKEECLLNLLPKAFPKQVAVLVWIDVVRGRVVLDSASQARCDDVAAALVACTGMSLSLLMTNTAPSTLMVELLVHDDPSKFEVESACELHTTDERKGVIRYKNESIKTKGVRDHIIAGRMPVSLALSYNGKVSFTLTEGGSLKGIEVIEIGDPIDDQDEFDADVAIFTGELAPLLLDLFEELGGLITLTKEEA